jgi:predicted DNA binding protein
MENTNTRATAFGRVLGALMEKRGMPASAGEIRALAERAGFDGEKFLALATSEDAPDVGPLSGLDKELALTDKEMTALALAYTYGREEAERAGG